MFKITFEFPKKEILLNASEMATQKISHLKPRCVKCARPYPTTHCPAKKGQTISAASSVEATTLPTTSVAWYIGNYKRPIHHFVQKSSLLLQTYKPVIFNKKLPMLK
jgi:hypothetical protein